MYKPFLFPRYSYQSIMVVMKLPPIPKYTHKRIIQFLYHSTHYFKSADTEGSFLYSRLVAVANGVDNHLKRIVRHAQRSGV